MKIFCLIPALNERENLVPLIAKLINVLPKVCWDYKIFFVIQGNDGSLNLLKKLKRKNKKIDWLYFPNALGIGKAYQAGFAVIDKNWSHVLTLDADLNHDPLLLPDFLKAMKNKRADMVIGSRFIEGGSFQDKRRWKRIISFLTNRIMTTLCRIKVHDISSGFRLIKKEVIDNVKENLSENGYPNYMELVIRAARKDYKISEVPIVYKARIHGRSKMGKLKTLIDYLIFLPRVFLTPENPD